MLEHVRPSVSFDHPEREESYFHEHGSPDSIAEAFDYLKENATFRIGFVFAF